MKLKFRHLLVLVPLVLGLAKNELVELEGYFNGRYSASFVKAAGNIKSVLPPGTQGRIEETTSFSSGNSGIKLEILSGPQKGEKVWVHYNPNHPNMKLYKNEKDMKANKSTAPLDQAQNAKTTTKVAALRVPAAADEAEKKEVVKKLSQQIQRGNRGVQEHAFPGGACTSCEVANIYSSDATLRKPLRTVNPFGIRSTRCWSSGDASYENCQFEGDTEPGFFTLRNKGPNRIVPKEKSPNRNWSFRYEGNAIQDLGFSISDEPNGTEKGLISEMTETYMMVFPRKTLPHIRVVGNRQIVTLPTGETVSFNKQTREVIGGVLTENGPMSRNGKSVGPANVTYKGSGVLVRVDKKGDDPRRQRNGTATITKQGRSCTVPVKDLWPNQSQSSPNHFKYSTDDEFNAYIKKKCGFGF